MSYCQGCKTRDDHVDSLKADLAAAKGRAKEADELVEQIATTRDDMVARNVKQDAELTRLREVLKHAHDYEESLMFARDPNRDPTTPDGITPRWWMDAHKLLNNISPAESAREAKPDATGVHDVDDYYEDCPGTCGKSVAECECDGKPTPTLTVEQACKIVRDAWREQGWAPPEYCDRIIAALQKRAGEVK